MRGARPLALALLLLLPTGPTSSAVERSARGPRGAAEVVKIKIVDDRYRNGTITIASGTVVKWTNRGDHTHTTTSDSGVWDSGNLSPGDTFKRRFRRAGTFSYHCQIHPTMRATITVT